MTLSPVTTEIIRSALIQAAEDMNTTLIRSAYTPTIYEGKDCAVALLDREHRVLGQSSGLPIFLGNLEECSRRTEEEFGPRVWQPGDVWVLNDSYIGGTHLNDCTVYAPIFVSGALVGFAASRAHWIDMGSKDPGGSMDSTTIYQEGLRMGPTRIVAGGEECADVLRLIATNVRFPDVTLGDMRAQVACARMGVRRLGELFARFGPDTVEAARREIFAQTERLERQRVAEIPDGVYTATGHLDNDGITLDVPLEVTVRITVDGAHMTIDLTQCADQTTGPVNCGRSQAVSAARVGYKLLISPSVSLNGGSFAPLDVVVREGSMLGAREPAACQYYYSSLGMLIDLIVKALAPAMPDRAAAASYGDSMIVQFAGDNPRTGKPFVTLEATVGGWGAWRGGDGESALINNVNGSLCDLPIEVFESLYPARVTEYRIRQGSGGDGRWRGGDGVVREYVMEADQDLSLWWERSATPAWGLDGGRPGTPPRVVLNPGTEDAREMLKANSLRVRKGDVLRCESGGGGGFGDPAARDSGTAG
ncbi:MULTISPECIES: hydantoinase B/oxoprolinase family protein [Streptomyces]|uniref:5-oxoprolinase n=1 Tax=Streptomyces cacaoi TaxID=1898 RepID=A0A4Y3QWF9_STRCI|nr:MULTISPECIES: hydantoinase B/oxoprolinase family protein [Streptomyces]NNG86475.1 hydantoinase B/oxoprolinase family protein [Streptomyces cacaoi]QHF95186.1 hydantoinase B/oxoprolinase family protein [Streptomyces sp. NHF165]GEB49007.1 5-oxoprolinase [Streptomyces cacaoi]